MLDDRVWQSFVTALQFGQCALVLGPDVPATVAGARAPCDGAPDVSLRDAFCGDLARQLEKVGQKVTERFLFAVAQQYVDHPALATQNLRYEAANFFKGEGFEPGPLHLALARLPFSTILTTCHDDLFATALKRADKDPCRRWYTYQGELHDYVEPPSPPAVETPLIYHLFGAFDDPTSLVLTENDLLDFIIQVLSQNPALPNSLRSSLRNKMCLFFGFGIRYWYLRVLLKLIVRALEQPSKGFQQGSIAIESFGALDAREREQTVLFYQRGTHIEVVDMAADQFLRELGERFNKAGGYRGTTRAPLRWPKVFISYERGDADVANALYEELRKREVEPWLDTHFLEGGDEWSPALEDRIEKCDYFLVLNSPRLTKKDVGYVNKELEKAEDRQKYRRHGLKFIIPLLVDDYPVHENRQELRRFDQLPLRRDALAQDVEKIARQIKRDHQLREQHGG